MTLFDFIRLIYRNLKLLFFIPVLMAVTVFFLTKNQPKEYGSGSLIYTGIASGYNIESGEGDKVDYHSVNNAFDNLLTIIKSRHTYEEVGLRLLSQHLTLTQPNPAYISKENFKLLQEAFPDSMRSRLRIKQGMDSVYEDLLTAYQKEDKKLVDLIRVKTTPYSIKTLNSIQAKRHKSSDMVELYYSSHDPGITQQTLMIFIDVFSRRYKEVKKSETGNVVEYFERELTKAKQNLNNSEDKLTDFRVNSRVINYGEQTKAIAIKKENALEEFSLKKMNLEATQSAVLAIEERLKVREDILSKNVDILDKKDELEALTTQLALMESNGKDSLMSMLIAKQEALKKAIGEDVETLYRFSNSKEGLPSKQLLTDWLNNVIQLNREKVNVELYKQRLVEIDEQYDHFAPLGSTIARLEREINVFEQSYLQILHGLNMSKLRQQNIEMSSNLEVIDWPSYPYEPMASKRMLMVFLALFVGFMGILSVLVTADLLDGTLKNPQKAAKDTSLELAGAFPVFNKEFNEKYQSVLPRLTGLIASKIKLEQATTVENKQEIIVFFSVSPREGNSTIARQLFEHLSAMGDQVALIAPQNEKSVAAEHIYHYEVDSKFTGMSSVQALVPQQDLSSYDYVLLVIPALNLGQVPIQIIRSSTLSLLTARADKAWLSAQKSMINNYVKLTQKQPLLVLNGVKLYYLDQILGELPIKRTKLVNRIRSFARFEFAKSKFNML